MPLRAGTVRKFSADRSGAEAADARLDAKLAKMTPREKELWREKQAKKQLRKSQGKVVMRRM